MLTKEERDEILQSIELFDSDRRGSITIKELGTAMHSLGYDRFMSPSCMNYDPLMKVLKSILKTRTLENNNKNINCTNLCTKKIIDNNNVIHDDDKEIDEKITIRINESLVTEKETETEITTIRKDLTSNEHQITLQDLMNLMDVDQCDDHNAMETEIETMFNLMDYQGRGVIGLEEMKKLCTDIGVEPGDQFLLELLTNINPEGVLSKSDTRLVMSKKTFQGCP